jgi:enamine deaminase RidA (YjgF/YER057c/UK114 family)
MPVKRISSGSAFEKVAGYSRAVVDDRYAHVSGTTGFDYATMTIADDVIEQTHQAFRNVSRALAEAELTLDDVVRVRCYLADRADFPKVAPLFGEYFARARPANTTVIATLVDPRIRIEIEVTARCAP